MWHTSFLSTRGRADKKADAANFKFDGLLQAIHNMVAEGRLSGEALNDIAKNATGYLGVVILKNKKGNWVQSNMGIAINFDEVNALKELSFWLENAEICQKNL